MRAYPRTVLKTVKEVEMIETEYLKDSVDNIRKLMSVLPLEESESERVQGLLRLSRIRKFNPGEQLIKEGDTDPWIYFLLSGKVKVQKEGVEISMIDNTGEMFGEMRLMDGMGRSATIIAEEKTVCLAVNTSAAANRLSSDQRADMLLLLYRIFTEYMAIRLRLMDEELVAAKKEIERLGGTG